MALQLAFLVWFYKNNPNDNKDFEADVTKSFVIVQSIWYWVFLIVNFGENTLYISLFYIFQITEEAADLDRLNQRE